MPAAAQAPDVDTQPRSLDQDASQPPRPSQPYPFELPNSFNPDEPFLGYFEGSEGIVSRRRASTPADLPKIGTISPMSMEPEPGEFPEEVRLGEEPWRPRAWGPRLFTWEESQLHHQPLYFEDVGLERYGHSYGVFQPLASFRRFNAQLLTLPYQMLVEPPRSCEYTLGYYRPGDHAPRLWYKVLPQRRGRYRPEPHYHVVPPTPHEQQAGMPNDETVEEGPSQTTPADQNTGPSAERGDQKEQGRIPEAVEKIEAGPGLVPNGR